MSAFPNWQNYAVHQRRRSTGCIPTCYEIMLRAANVQGIDFGTFQDDFDLDRHGGPPQNHFNSVAEAVQKRYPHVEFSCETFQKGEGKNKLDRVEEFISQKMPVLVSITNEPNGGRGWHIMAVVDATDSELVLLDHVDQHGQAHTRTLSKGDFVKYHDNFKGGDEIAYLNKP